MVWQQAELQLRGFVDFKLLPSSLSEQIIWVFFVAVALHVASNHEVVVVSDAWLVGLLELLDHLAQVEVLGFLLVFLFLFLLESQLLGLLGLLSFFLQLLEVVFSVLLLLLLLLLKLSHELGLLAGLVSLFLQFVLLKPLLYLDLCPHSVLLQLLKFELLLLLNHFLGNLSRFLLSHLLSLHLGKFCSPSSCSFSNLLFLLVLSSPLEFQC